MFDIEHLLSASHTIETPTLILRLGLACLLVLPLGLDREIRSKAAGLRSYMLASLGGCVFALLTLALLEDPKINAASGGNPFAVMKAVAEAAAVFAAGTMIARHGDMRGVTTGIGLWLSTGVGLGVGFGLYLITGLAAVLAAIIVSLIGLAEARWLDADD
ncbi:MgtC/SapB family protein [Pseudokordiimonas caeni]|uniref:MgtC/SapB family protein n=1 Tax=Pseudokordiimonas caeni TaxID=2997908 RepID=UPI002811EA15|nr:MgtC/SapB family protein [Pseudokordiimonas caeni]